MFRNQVGGHKTLNPLAARGIEPVRCEAKLHDELFLEDLVRQHDPVGSGASDLGGLCSTAPLEK